MNEPIFFNRDISWLYFNERVLLEAADSRVPLLERIKFLSIYSANLTEYYRVRMPVLMALDYIRILPDSIERLPDMSISAYENAERIIMTQQQIFGNLLSAKIIPALLENNIHLLYNNDIPECIKDDVCSYFFTTIAAFIIVVYFSVNNGFFPANNGLYIVVELENEDPEKTFAVINIPSENIPRFFNGYFEGTQYIVFIDDIIRSRLPILFPGKKIKGAYSIKITRDAVLDLAKEFDGDIAKKIEKQISKRDEGMATRFLFQPGLPFRLLQTIIASFNLYGAAKMQGGNYHNLKDLAFIPVKAPALEYKKRKPVRYSHTSNPGSLFKEILQNDIMINPPYHSYDTVLRFFNEAAIDEEVQEIYTTMYRVAHDSRIIHALISATANGKSVTVFVELKARFDEANNIKWAKRMKTAGVKIIYTNSELKVHSKITLVKKKQSVRTRYIGLLATGNLNENTAKYYTDHILLTAHHEMLRELEMVFLFLSRRKRPGKTDALSFDHLLVSQFNLLEKFIALIDAEISNARQGFTASITIKLNNLEERVLIAKLYEASNAGVQVNLIVRSICCLIPGVAGMSENITVRRIVDRYLEHGRVFVFYNNGIELFFMGSSDWMNRNIYHRIEVCFPVYDKTIQADIKHLLELQLADNQSAFEINDQLQNVPVTSLANPMRSQDAIYDFLHGKETGNGFVRQQVESLYQ